MATLPLLQGAVLFAGNFQSFICSDVHINLLYTEQIRVFLSSSHLGIFMSLMCCVDVLFLLNHSCIALAAGPSTSPLK